MSGDLVTADATIAGAVENAPGLALAWRLLPGTVLDGRDIALARVRLDGDQAGTAAPQLAVSMVGPLTIGQRVWCLVVPPAGLYVVGVASRPKPIERVYTADDTWSYPSGLRALYAIVVGGGGGGGGADITVALQWAFSDGGGGGEYRAGWIDLADLGATEAVTVGPGGAGGVATIGAAGTASSFGAHITANGGGFGSTRAPTTTAAYTSNTTTRAGGTGGTGGDIAIPGMPGGMGVGVTSATFGVRGGDGGPAGGGMSGVGREGLNTNGNAGQQYGGGGGAAANSASQGSQRTGGAGADGVVILTEYY